MALRTTMFALPAIFSSNFLGARLNELFSASVAQAEPEQGPSDEHTANKSIFPSKFLA